MTWNQGRVQTMTISSPVVAKLYFLDHSEGTSSIPGLNKNSIVHTFEFITQKALYNL